MQTWMTIILMAMALTVLGLIVLAIILYFRIREEKDDNNFCLNFMAHKNGYRAYGEVLDVNSGPWDRKMMVMQPKDISLKEILKGVKPTPKKIFFNKYSEVSLPKGSLSIGKNINIIFPNKASELSEELKSTDFGKCLALYIETKNADKAVITALQSGMKDMATHVKELNAGEATVSLMNTYKEFLSDVLEASLKSPKDKTTTIPSFGQSSGV